jgi:hypothetical protein
VIIIRDFDIPNGDTERMDTDTSNPLSGWDFSVQAHEKYYLYTDIHGNRHSLVGIVTDYELGNRASVPDRGKRFLCKISGFHGGDYEECSLPGCYAVWLFSSQSASVVSYG